MITYAYSHFFLFREFTLAEIEHFVDPTDKSHPKFENVSSQKVTLYPSENQIEGKPPLNISLEDAVNQVSGLLFLRRFCEILTLGSVPHSFFMILALYQMFHSSPPCDSCQFFHYQFLVSFWIKIFWLVQTLYQKPYLKEFSFQKDLMHRRKTNAKDSFSVLQIKVVRTRIDWLKLKLNEDWYWIPGDSN